MRALPIGIITALAGLAFIPNTAFAIPTTFAQTTQFTSSPQLTIMNNGVTTLVTGSGQDFFTFLVGGTPFGNPVLANFTLNASSTSNGSCGTAGCPNGDSFTQQGFTGSFQYIVAAGPFLGMNLLSGTFNTSATPANSGGTVSQSVGGTGGSYLASQTGSNPTAVVFSSDFLNFAGVSLETGAWGLSALSPNFAVNGTGTGAALGTTFSGAQVATFSSEPPPTAGNAAPEPATMVLMGAALVGLGMIGKKRLAR
jgi:hypothetical protein